MSEVAVLVLWCTVFTVFTSSKSENGKQCLARTEHEDLKYMNLVKHEFHYLNVTAASKEMVPSEDHCGFKCLEICGCFSVNVVAPTQSNEPILCELLSSDMYNNSKEFKRSKNSHHLSIWSPCSMEPCKNGATCVANYKDDTYTCLCGPDFGGKHCVDCVGVTPDGNETGGWKIINQSSYKFFPVKKTWPDANRCCKQINATLVTIHSQEENSFVASLIPDDIIQPVFIGANDADVEGTWVWVDGSDLGEYANWAVMEPTGGNSGQDCIGMHPLQNYQWHDISCSSQRSFICESSAKEEERG